MNEANCLQQMNKPVYFLTICETNRETAWIRMRDLETRRCIRIKADMVLPKVKGVLSRQNIVHALTLLTT